MKASVTNVVKGIGLAIIGVAIAAAGIFLGEYDDAPGASLIGILLMIGAVVLRRRGSHGARHSTAFDVDQSAKTVSLRS